MPVQVGGPEECPWPIAEALATNELVFVPDCAGLVTGFESRSWGELPETAVVIPISDGDSRQLVLVCGLNTRRPCTQPFFFFLSLFNSIYSALMMNVDQIDDSDYRVGRVCEWVVGCSIC